jgi:hypothetical protein
MIILLANSLYDEGTEIYGILEVLDRCQAIWNLPEWESTAVFLFARHDETQTERKIERKGANISYRIRTESTSLQNLPLDTFRRGNLSPFACQFLQPTSDSST